MESLGPLDGHRDKKNVSEYSICPWPCVCVCMFYCVCIFNCTVFAEDAFGGLGGLSGRTGEKCLKVMNLDCTITVRLPRVTLVGQAVVKL